MFLRKERLLPQFKINKDTSGTMGVIVKQNHKVAQRPYKQAGGVKTGFERSLYIAITKTRTPKPNNLTRSRFLAHETLFT